MLRVTVLAALAMCLAATPASAQVPDVAAMHKQLTEVMALVRGLQTTIAEQQRQIQDLSQRLVPRIGVAQPPGGQNRELEEALEAQPAARPPAPRPPAVAVVPSVAAGLAAFNPEIGVVGDVVGNLSRRRVDEEFGRRFAFREAEAVFGTFVDPFSRADFALVFNDVGEVEIEEAFYSHFDLPFQLRAKVGKFRSKIGKVNLVDLNALAMVNEPLVIRQFFGEEGLARTGAQVQRLVPNPWDLFVELTGEIVDGGNDVAFGGKRSKPVGIGHLKAFADLTPFSNVEVGLTTMRGVADARGRRRTHVHGADLTFKRKRAVFDALTFQNEVYFLRQDLPHRNRTRTGWYNWVDYRFAPRWSAGLRYDNVQPLEGKRQWAVQPYLTFHQSEFARVQVAFQHTRLPDRRTNDEVFLRFRFQIGVDRHGLQ